jgi:ferric iron reductase protein FhuF
MDAGDLLREISTVGAYFDVQPAAVEGAWSPLRELFDPDVLTARVNRVRAVLAERTGLDADDLDARACASIHFLALSSRVLSPVLAGVALRGVALDPDPEQMWWQAVDGGPIPLAWASFARSRASSAADGARRIEDGVLAHVLGPLADAYQRTFRLSEQVLLGNAASALNGAATMLLATGRELIIEPGAIADALLARGRLAGTGEYSAGRKFSRNNCCLFYRVPGGGVCGDCILARRELAARTH